MTHESITRFAGQLEKDPVTMSEMTSNERAYAALPERTKAAASAVVDVLGTLDGEPELTTGRVSSWLSEKEPQLVGEEVAETLRGLMDSDDGMSDLDFAIRHEAQSRNITLDSSAYDCMFIGLPYNIPFTVRKQA